jgi:NAD(P)-dependent dehydrogenase (short-subunit alcohol dehydrogenase family)
MNLNGSVALVTGGNRGLGAQFVQALLESGASKVYAAARDPRTVTTAGAVPIQLDVTDHASVLAAAAQAPDVSLLINNAGILTPTSILEGDFDTYRLEYDTHVLGTLDVTRAFAPILAANGGGAVLNVLSVLSWASLPHQAAYCAAKSAEWSITNSLRVELAAQGTRVSSLHVGYMDTDMIADLDGVEKNDPRDVANTALAGIERGEFEIIADDFTRQIKSGLAHGIEALYPQLAAS